MHNNGTVTTARPCPPQLFFFSFLPHENLLLHFINYWSDCSLWLSHQHRLMFRTPPPRTPGPRSPSTHQVLPACLVRFFLFCFFWSRNKKPELIKPQSRRRCSPQLPCQILKIWCNRLNHVKYVRADDIFLIAPRAICLPAADEWCFTWCFAERTRCSFFSFLQGESPACSTGCCSSVSFYYIWHQLSECHGCLWKPPHGLVAWRHLPCILSVW